VSNASPLIALEQIGKLDLLEKLFLNVLIPPAVTREITSIVTLPAWIIKSNLIHPIGPQILSASLGAGESEAISLGLEVGAQWVILDDRPARRAAEAIGLPAIGTLGILLAAKRRGFLTVIRPNLDKLIGVGFRVSTDLYKQVLTDAGESGQNEI
jgi:hypothetical protein